ncbi:ABC transporter ATP-binding protein [Leucobacter massiliensis]|uniref:Iron-dicitrate transporter ATP-binding subunit n=1 Tax=Leucobacter massiliensis TaxID=1686285 RepID=A0A2S9QLK3_9MICO|nr:ABC transporter ATP-binding protein [Leucobacter massiliensis]PRI10453.1 iron-dicitrate transporter ATP-binding subunit [Leucobacter massiliensis]
MNTPLTPTPSLAPARLRTDAVRLGYAETTVIHDVSISIPDGSFTVIVGANGCGKSTLLRALARVEKPRNGAILLDGSSIATSSTKEVARTIGLLPQSSTAPEGIRVAELVARGRYAHQSMLRRWSDDDERAVTSALASAGMSELSERPLDALSGGQRQRAWIAMALAREAPILLLDEPTTYLDIAHQVSVLELIARQNRQGTTVAAVLHDLNQAARYGTHMIALKDGRVAAVGPPAEVITPSMVREVFDLETVIVPDPVAGTPMVVAVGGAEAT